MKSNVFLGLFLILFILCSISCTQSPQDTNTSIEQDDKVTVIFDTNNGPIIEPQIIEKNEKLKTPPQPKKKGYEFIAWYIDNSYSKIFDFSTPITNNMTLYAFYLSTAAVEPNEDGSYTINPYNIENTLKAIPAEVTEVTLILECPNKYGLYDLQWNYNMDRSIDDNYSSGIYDYQWCSSICYSLSKFYTKKSITLNLTLLKELRNINSFYIPRIENLILPKSVESISLESRLIKNIFIDDSNPYFKSIDGVVYSKDEKTLCIYPSGRTDNSFTIKESVSTIDSRAFHSCYSLNMLIICNPILDFSTLDPINCFIKTISFHGTLVQWCEKNKPYRLMENLEELYINDELITGSITIPEGTSFIGDYSFYNCQKITGIKFPTSVKSLGNYCFTNCTLLENLSLPDSIESIGTDSFSNCIWLESVSIGNGLETIPQNTFSDCISLKDVNFGNKVQLIEQQAFSNCSMLEYISLPSQIKTIHNTSFEKCPLNNVSFSGTITQWLSIENLPDYLLEYIDKTMYSGDIIIPDSITKIKSKAFYNFNNITSVTIGKNVSIIDEEAFSHCSELKTVILNDTLNAINKKAFSNCLTLENITIPSSVKSIGDEAFSNCSSLKLVTMNDNLQEIGNKAFINCLSLENITIPSSVKSIGDEAFSNCSSLKLVTINDNLQEIGNKAFINCSSLENITIPSSVKSIGKYCFQSCENLKTIIIGENVETIGAYTFLGCNNLTTLTFKQTDNWYYDNILIPANKLTIKNLTNGILLDKTLIRKDNS